MMIINLGQVTENNVDLLGTIVCPNLWTTWVKFNIRWIFWGDQVIQHKTRHLNAATANSFNVAGLATVEYWTQLPNWSLLFYIVLFIIIITSNMINRKVTLILFVGNKSAESSGPRRSGRYSLRFTHHDGCQQMIIDHDNDDSFTIPVSDVLHLGDDNCTSLMSKCCRANSGWLENRKETNKKCIVVPPSVEM